MHVEKFLARCPPDYKLSGIYIIDAVVRAAQKQQSPDADSLIRRFEEKLEPMFQYTLSAPSKDKVCLLTRRFSDLHAILQEKMVKVLGLWKKGSAFNTEMLDVIEKSYLSNRMFMSDSQIDLSSLVEPVQSHPAPVNPKDPRLKKTEATSSNTSVNNTTTESIQPQSNIDSAALISTLATLAQMPQQNSVNPLAALLPLLQQQGQSGTQPQHINSSLLSTLASLNQPGSASPADVRSRQLSGSFSDIVVPSTILPTTAIYPCSNVSFCPESGVAAGLHESWTLHIWYMGATLVVQIASNPIYSLVTFEIFS